MNLRRIVTRTTVSAAALLAAALLLPSTGAAKDDTVNYTPYKIRGSVAMELPSGWDQMLNVPIPIVSAIDIGESTRLGRYYNEVTEGTLTIIVVEGEDPIFYLQAIGVCTAASGGKAYWEMDGPIITFLFGEGHLEGETGGFTMTSVSPPEIVSPTVVKFSYAGEGEIGFEK